LDFDPENLKMSDVQNIANNADNLIKIIQNIKEKVVGPEPAHPDEENEALQRSEPRIEAA
jgi:hypothetical protein